MMIKELRKATGMTQRAFSEYLNIPQRSIESWEEGQRNPPEYVVELIASKLEYDGLIEKNFLKNFAKRL